MDLRWLEDFLALSESGSFSAAARRRNITQPAFSRRVRALEAWLGAVLIDRDTHRICLTQAGERFRPVAEATVRRLHQARDEASEAARSAIGAIRFASTHTLSLTVLPAWLRGLEAEGEPLGGAIQLLADTTLACERMLLRGQVHFLLSHHHASKPTLLPPDLQRSLPIGNDVLLPVSAPCASGTAAPLFDLAGGEEFPLLAYDADAGLGRIVQAELQHRPMLRPRPVCTSPLASVLVAMARDRRGVAWAPRSLVADDLSAGRLIAIGAGHWDVPAEIRLARLRPRLPTEAERFWARVAHSLRRAPVGR